MCATFVMAGTGTNEGEQRVYADTIVFSRPIWSDIQPTNGRDRPSSTRSNRTANCRVGSVQKRKVTGAAPILKSRTRDESCPSAIIVPVPAMTNVAHMTQNVGDLSTSPGVKSRFVC